MSDHPRHPFAFYRDIDAVNWSSLKRIRESPAHYKWHRDHPDKDTNSMAKGRAVHTLVFEPELFEGEYVIWNDERGAKGWKAFKEEHDGACILTAAEVIEARAMADAVRSHPLVRPYLDGGMFERTLLWQDKVTGLQCKARLDWIQPLGRFLIDLKTSTTSERFRFGRIAARLGYHCQLAHYAAGVKAALGWEPARVMIVVVESAAPFDVAVYFVGEDSLWAGEEEVRDLMLKLHGCVSDDHWPSRYEDEQELQLPPWVFGTEDEDVAAMGLQFGSEGS